jgi:hypothetical protein
MKRCPCGAPGEYQIGNMNGRSSHYCHECIQITIPKENREETYRRLKAIARRPEIQSGKLKKGKK